MKARLQTAISVFEERFGEGSARELIKRTEVDREQALVLTVEGPALQCWLRFDAGQLTEIEPDLDRRLPCAPSLTELRRQGASILSWRPGRRITLRAAREEQGLGERIVKGFHKHSARVAERMAIAAAAAHDGVFRVPRVEDLDAGGESLTLELCEGGELSLGSGSEEVFFRIGHGLRRFQEQGKLNGLDVHGRMDECQILSRLATRVESVAGEIDGEWSALLERLSHVAAEDARQPLVLTHRDLHDGQFLTGDGSTTLLDFDLLCAAEPALDVANLTAHLRLRALQGVRGATPVTAEAAGDALLEGFDRNAESGFFESLRFYQASTFLRLALLYRLRPRWSSLAPSLIVLAKRCLQEAAHL